MSRLRWRDVRVAGLRWMLFDDALVQLRHVEGVRSVAPDVGREGDDRAIVELASGHELRVHYLPPTADPDDDPAVLMGFEVREGGVAAFVDATALLSEVVALVRDPGAGMVAVWPAPDLPAWLIKARPYPWERT